MIRSNKIVLFVCFLFLLQANLVLPASKLKQYWKPATALGVAGLVGYGTQKTIDIGASVAMKLCPDLDSTHAEHVRNVLLSKWPQDLPKDLVQRIKFKKDEKKFWVMVKMLWHQDRLEVRVAVR